MVQEPVLLCFLVFSPDRDVIYIDQHKHYDRAEVGHRRCVWWAGLAATQGELAARLGPVFIIWYGSVV